MAMGRVCLLKDKDFTNKKSEMKKPLYEKKNIRFLAKRKKMGIG
jgi:hypothetical protein